MKAFALALFLFSLTNAVRAADLPASNCELFLRSVRVTMGSHGDRGFEVVFGLGGPFAGRTPHRIGFHSQKATLQYGRAASCGMSDGSFGPFEIREASRSGGESRMWFSVARASVSECRTDLSERGAFFLEIDGNTYWLNPNLNPDELFYFDQNAWSEMSRKSYGEVSTSREDMKYYNPVGCR